jgi:transcriptional regulator with XRE-family HTH domain
MLSLPIKRYSRKDHKVKKAAQALPNERLKRAREQRCWSQRDVADMIGAAALNVSRWERGITSPNAYFRRELCRCFETTPCELGFLDEAEESAAKQQPPASSVPSNVILLPEKDNTLPLAELASLAERIRSPFVIVLLQRNNG